MIRANIQSANFNNNGNPDYDFHTGIYTTEGWHFFAISIFYNGYMEELTNFDFYMSNDEFNNHPVNGRTKIFSKRDIWGKINNDNVANYPMTCSGDQADRIN